MSVVAISFGGAARSSSPAGLAFAGTASADRSDVSTGYIATGSAKGDWTKIAPWLSTDRLCGVRVTFDEVDVTTLIGEVSIDEDVTTTTRTASLSVLDPRATAFFSGSLTLGGVPVAIYLTEKNAVDEDEWLAFSGTLEAAGNDGNYCPQASLRAVSTTANLDNATTGFFHAEPFSNKTRREVLEEYAASDETECALSIRLTGASLNRPIDISGVSVQTLLQRYCVVEGWFARESDLGKIEVLTEQQVIGAAPFFDFTEDFYTAIREVSPNRPVTVLTVGGSRMPTKLVTSEDKNPTTIIDEQSGVDENGKRWKRVTTTYLEWGVEMTVTQELWRDYIRRGQTNYPEYFMLTDRTVTENTYVTTFVPWWRDNRIVGYNTVPTAQLEEVVVETWGYYSPPCGVATGVEWEDGTYHNDLQEYFARTGRSVTEYTYTDPTEFRASVLQKSHARAWGYYSRLYNDGGLGVLYDDGSYRYDSHWYFTLVGEIIETFSDNIDAMMSGTTATRITKRAKETKGYMVTALDTVSTVVYPRESYTTIAFDGESKSGVPHETYHVKNTAQIDYKTGVQNYSRTTEAGMSPDPETAQADIPQYGLEGMIYTLSVYEGLYPRVTGSIQNDDAQDETELIRAARRHMWFSLGTRCTIACPMVRGLKPWTVVQVWNRVRLYGYTYNSQTGVYTRLDNGKVGVIESVHRTADPLNGWHGMEVTVLFPPPEIWKVTT